MSSTNSASLKGAIDEIIEILKKIDGIRSASTLREVSNTALQAFAFGSSGEYKNEPNTIIKGLHSIQIGVAAPITSYYAVQEFLLPIGDRVATAIFEQNQRRKWQNIQTLGSITYTLSPITHAGEQLYGYIFTLNDVKLMSELYP